MSCSCGKEFEAKLWDCLNISEQKELKAKLLNGEINQVQCSACKKKSYVEKNLLYQDMDKKIWIQMLPTMDRSNWPGLEEDYAEVLRKNSGVRKFRLTFGREELFEKIRIFDWDLDDRAIELLKLKIMSEDENMKNLSDAKLVFIRYLPQEEEIHFSLTSAEKELNQTIVVSSQHYETILENKEHTVSNDEMVKKIVTGVYVNVTKNRVLH